MTPSTGSEYYQRLINMGVEPAEAVRLTQALFGWLSSLPRS